MGLEASKAEAVRLTNEAREALACFGTAAARLHEIADHLLARDF